MATQVPEPAPASENQVPEPAPASTSDEDVDPRSAIPLRLREQLWEICRKYTSHPADTEKMLLDLGTTDADPIHVKDEHVEEASSTPASPLVQFLQMSIGSKNAAVQSKAVAERSQRFPPYEDLQQRAGERLASGQALVPGATAGFAPKGSDGGGVGHLQFLPQSSHVKDRLVPGGRYWIDGPLGYFAYEFDAEKNNLCPGGGGDAALATASTAATTATAATQKQPCIVGGKVYKAGKNWYWAQMPQRRYYKLDPDEETAKLARAMFDDDNAPKRGERWIVTEQGAKMLVPEKKPEKGTSAEGDTSASASTSGFVETDTDTSFAGESANNVEESGVAPGPEAAPENPDGNTSALPPAADAAGADGPGENTAAGTGTGTAGSPDGSEQVPAVPPAADATLPPAADAGGADGTGENTAEGTGTATGPAGQPDGSEQVPAAPAAEPEAGWHPPVPELPKPGVPVTATPDENSEVIARLDGQYQGMVVDRPSALLKSRVRMQFPGKRVVGWVTWDVANGSAMEKVPFREKNFFDFVRGAQFDLKKEEKKLQNEMQKATEASGAAGAAGADGAKADQLRHEWDKAHCVNVKYGGSRGREAATSISTLGEAVTAPSTSDKEAALRCANGDVVDSFLSRLRITTEVVRDPEAIRPYEDEQAPTSAAEMNQAPPEELLRNDGDVTNNETRVAFFDDLDFDIGETTTQLTKVGALLNDFLFFPPKKDENTAFRIEVIGPGAPLNYPSYVRRELAHPRAWSDEWHAIAKWLKVGAGAPEAAGVEREETDRSTSSAGGTGTTAEKTVQVHDGDPRRPRVDIPGSDRVLSHDVFGDNTIREQPIRVRKPFSQLVKTGGGVDKVMDTSNFFQNGTGKAAANKGSSIFNASADAKPAMAFVLATDNAAESASRDARRNFLQPSIFDDDGASRMVYLAPEGSNPLVSAPCVEGEPFSCMKELRDYLGVPARPVAGGLESSLEAWWDGYMANKKILAQ